MKKFKNSYILATLVLLVVLGVIIFRIKEASRKYFELSVDPKIHDDYGLAFPITYEFSIPPESSNLSVYKRHTESQEWQQISEKKSTDFFNGIEVVRFDYPQNKVRLSVAFDDSSDKIQLKITDNSDQIVNSKYLGIPKYYDNRKAAVVVVGDDWGLWGAKDKEKDPIDFKAAFDVFAADGIWFTPAATTQKGVLQSDWQSLQRKIDQGYVEVAAHSRTHPSLPYDDYDSEIRGCKSDIIDNLDLSYKNGDKEYVYAWVRPYGQGNDIVRAKLGENKFLIDKLSCCFITDTFTKWDFKNGLYKPTGYSIYLEKSSLKEANKKFDEIIKQGGIYSIYMHPYNINWEKNSWERQHFDYIKNKADLWYTGLGYLYMYHFARERNIISVSVIN
ncbi:hypothetical protein KJA15_02820 [Patescibacteria group bacterium]|nr:hypothetical protein [Patescibacteria group bacterium]